MNALQNFHAMMKGEAYRWMPMDLPMTGPVIELMELKTGNRDAVSVFDLDFRSIWASHPDRHGDWAEAYVRLGVRLPRDAQIGDEGYGYRMPPMGTTGKAWHLTEMLHPLESLGDLDVIKGLPWRNPDDSAPFSSFASQVRTIHEEGKVAVHHSECTMFESAWYTRSMDALFADIIEENSIAEFLFDHFAAMSRASCVAAAKAGVDLICLGDDVGTQRGMMMSVEMWRHLLRPRLAEITAAIREARPGNPPWIQYHSDGDIRPIIEDLIEIGVDILNPVQPECMPLDDVAGRWKERLAFCGMIGTQTTMPFGSEDDVRACARDVLAWADKGARMIVAPTHVLQPDVPWENILALTETVRNWRPKRHTL